MDVGIFARTFPRPTLEETLDAVVEHNMRHIQFTMQCAGLEPLPAEIPAEIVSRIREAVLARDLTMTALSGTFNMAHPDERVVIEGLRRLELLVLAAGEMDAHMISLCTGTRDPDNMWRWHPDNDSPQAWTDAWGSLGYVMALAYEHATAPLFGIEPEPGNIVSDARKARQMLYELGSDQFGVIFDPANIIAGVSEEDVESVIGSALAEIGHRIICVHGKDRDASGRIVPVGDGIVPWEFLIAGLRRAGYDGTILLHGLEEARVPEAKTFLQNVIARNG
jgi:sugar phosphate isomerase/epimerase